MHSRDHGYWGSVLYCRYIAWIKETWPTCAIRVCLRDYEKLIDVFGDYTQIAEFTTDHELSEDSDFTVDALSALAIAHGTRSDNILPDPGFLRRRVLEARRGKACDLPTPPSPAIKVGLVWTGTPRSGMERSVPLELLLPLAADPRVALYSFQFGPGHADIARLHAEPLLHDVEPYIQREGWVGTGLALMEMDVVITVCTSVAHFAGAIGVPTWLLLSADPFWIWGREGSTTAWYPSMRLFRQELSGIGAPSSLRVRTELAKLADKRVVPVADRDTGRRRSSLSRKHSWGSVPSDWPPARAGMKPWSCPA